MLISWLIKDRGYNRLLLGGRGYNRLLPGVRGCNRRRGFSLIEVLVSLAIGSLVLGVVMADVSRDVVVLSRMEPRYRALITANTVLEKAASDHSNASESGVENDLAYTISSGPVPADARVLELKATVVDSTGREVKLAIYRLRSLSTKNSDSGTASQ